MSNEKIHLDENDKLEVIPKQILKPKQEQQKEKIFKETTSKLEDSVSEDTIKKLLNLRHKLIGKEKKNT